MKTIREADAIAQLEAMTGDDPEADHGLADEILLRRLRALGDSKVVAAYERAQERCGFWYA